MDGSAEFLGWVSARQIKNQFLIAMKERIKKCPKEKLPKVEWPKVELMVTFADEVTKQEGNHVIDRQIYIDHDGSLQAHEVVTMVEAMVDKMTERDGSIPLYPYIDKTRDNGMVIGYSSVHNGKVEAVFKRAVQSLGGKIFFIPDQHISR